VCKTTSITVLESICPCDVGAALLGQAADNPDQRIAEDIHNFLNSTYAYSISLLSTVSTLVSFSIILWTIPADFTIPGTGITVPGLPFWVALVCSLVLG
jgi:vitamin B12/bleomycin/antimicrobial peptide transport system ATP-binding/permease protein